MLDCMQERSEQTSVAPNKRNSWHAWWPLLKLVRMLCMSVGIVKLFSCRHRMTLSKWWQRVMAHWKILYACPSYSVATLWMPHALSMYLSMYNVDEAVDCDSNITKLTSCASQWGVNKFKSSSLHSSLSCCTSLQWKWTLCAHQHGCIKTFMLGKPCRTKPSHVMIWLFSILCMYYGTFHNSANIYKAFWLHHSLHKNPYFAPFFMTFLQLVSHISLQFQSTIWTIPYLKTLFPHTLWHQPLVFNKCAIYTFLHLFATFVCFMVLIISISKTAKSIHTHTYQ